MTGVRTEAGAVEIVIATRNKGKLREIRQILAGLPVTVRSLSEFPNMPEVVEDAPTFRGNAEKKARAVAAYTGGIAVADDSGLCVNALDGEPGVHSARYAGEGASDPANCRKLLDALVDVPDEKRTARFVCDLCVFPVEDGAVHLTGEAEGVILREPRGENGFGYDPVFLDVERGKTFAELPAETKNEISHRARALAGLPALLSRLVDRS